MREESAVTTVEVDLRKVGNANNAPVTRQNSLLLIAMRIGTAVTNLAVVK